jgi:RNA polymerase sigma factor (sigma-70 family)
VHGEVVHIDRDHVYREMIRRFGAGVAEEANDAVAQSAVAIWMARESGTTIYNANAFCTVVAKRALLRAKAWHQRHVYPDRDRKVDWTRVSEWEETMQVEVNHDAGIDAETIIDAAPENYAEVFRMVYLEGRTMEDIARELNVTPECIRKRHERALKWARNKFSGEGG